MSSAVSTLFQTGAIYSTASVVDACMEHAPLHDFVQSCLARHRVGDWGDCDPDDCDTNDSAVVYGYRILSAYTIPDGVYTLADKIWIITEWDRSYTTVLFPSDY